MNKLIIINNEPIHFLDSFVSFFLRKGNSSRRFVFILSISQGGMNTYLHLTSREAEAQALQGIYLKSHHLVFPRDIRRSLVSWPHNPVLLAWTQRRASAMGLPAWQGQCCRCPRWCRRLWSSGWFSPQYPLAPGQAGFCNLPLTLQGSCCTYRSEPRSPSLLCLWIIEG